MPSVNRAWPVWVSSPTSPIARPMNRLASPRAAEAPRTADTVVKASTMTAKYSAGPNFNANSTATGAITVSRITAMVPATKEPMAAVANAGPARPRLAIMLPSIAVMMVADSPGVFSRIEVVEPPNIAP